MNCADVPVLDVPEVTDDAAGAESEFVLDCEHPEKPKAATMEMQRTMLVSFLSFNDYSFFLLIHTTFQTTHITV